MEPHNETPVPGRDNEPAGAGANGMNGGGFFDPAPFRFSPEELARIRDEVSEEELIALLKEMEGTGGLTSEEFFRGLEQAAGGDV
jgi:hypothetical protein